MDPQQSRQPRTIWDDNLGDLDSAKSSPQPSTLLHFRPDCTAGESKAE